MDCLCNPTVSDARFTPRSPLCRVYKVAWYLVDLSAYFLRRFLGLAGTPLTVLVPLVMVQTVVWVKHSTRDQWCKHTLAAQVIDIN
jgi:hypothetical protein